MISSAVSRLIGVLTRSRDSVPEILRTNERTNELRLSKPYLNRSCESNAREELDLEWFRGSGFASVDLLVAEVERLRARNEALEHVRLSTAREIAGEAFANGVTSEWESGFNWAIECAAEIVAIRASEVTPKRGESHADQE